MQYDPAEEACKNGNAETLTQAKRRGLQVQQYQTWKYRAENKHEQRVDAKASASPVHERSSRGSMQPDPAEITCEDCKAKVLTQTRGIQASQVDVVHLLLLFVVFNCF